MIIKTMSSTIDELTSKFYYHHGVVRRAEVVEPKFNLDDLGKFIGNVDGQQIWIIKLRSLPTNLPQRYFRGKLVERNNEVYIEGRFVFHEKILCRSIATFFVFFLLFLCVNVFGNITKNLVFSFMFALSVAGLGPAFGVLFSIHSENEVRKLLKKL